MSNATDRGGVTLRAIRSNTVGGILIAPDRDIWVADEFDKAIDRLHTKHLGRVLNDSLMSIVAYEANLALAEAFRNGHISLEDREGQEGWSLLPIHQGRPPCLHETTAS